LRTGTIASFCYGEGGVISVCHSSGNSIGLHQAATERGEAACARMGFRNKLVGAQGGFPRGLCNSLSPLYDYQVCRWLIFRLFTTYPTLFFHYSVFW